MKGSAIGTTGYCLGGRMSLIAAAGLGREIAAASSFHGGRQAVADDPKAGARHWEALNDLYRAHLQRS